MNRSCGILMSVSSLPSAHGIGTLGEEAFRFIDFLKEAGQSYWQMLPLGPTGYGDSPYQSIADRAGNPYFIDLDLLKEDGLLLAEEIGFIDGLLPGRAEKTDSPAGDDAPAESCDKVDYGHIFKYRFNLLKIAYQRGITEYKDEFRQFADENAGWLQDYALFMAVKKHFGMKSHLEWPDEEIRLRRPEAMKKYSELLREDVEFYSFLQFLFFKQWDALRAYAHENGVKIIGDVPIYVAMDSADTWADPGIFQLDEKNIPLSVAGVPPDYFSEDGQLWGNPLYDWDKLKEEGYGWWIDRIGAAGRLYDVIRIDHFRGFESYWSVKYGEKTARSGKWIKGPGSDFTLTVKNWFKDLEFIAEDLGILTDEVTELLEVTGFPGMKVLQFAFDPENISIHLPQFHKENSVVYTGTHDNTTLAAWQEDKPEEADFAREYLGAEGVEDISMNVIRCGMASKAKLCIVPMQDYLGLGADARMNIPGTAQGNWRWRMDKEALSRDLAAQIKRMAHIYSRTGK